MAFSNRCEADMERITVARAMIPTVGYLQNSVLLDPTRSVLHETKQLVDDFGLNIPHTECQLSLSGGSAEGGQQQVTLMQPDHPVSDYVEQLMSENYCLRLTHDLPCAPASNGLQGFDSLNVHPKP